MEWHERHPARWEAERRIAASLLDDYRSGVGGGTAFVEGVFRVRSEHGHVYESVTIRIVYPADFPARGQAPRVVLLSHRDRWQAIADAHIYDDWSLCLFVPGESPVDFSLADSLNGLFAVLHTFLFKQHIFQRDLARERVGGRRAVWPGAARAHGPAGVDEAIRDLGGVGRNQPCPCGSGKKFKHCCLRRTRR